jgi:hypothetical protein
MAKKRVQLVSCVGVIALVIFMALSNIPKATALADDDFTVSITITGVVQSVSPTTITLEGNTVITVPAGVSIPADVISGATVTLTAAVTDDGLVLTVSDPNTATPQETDEDTETPESTLNVTLPATLPVTLPPTLLPTLPATLPATLTANCGSDNTQPVAQRLATAFGVSYDEIMAWHCKGYGFGEIAKAYKLAQLTGKTASDIFALRMARQGWGNIVKSLGVNPKDLAPGQAMKGTADGNSHNKGKGDDQNKDNGNGNGKGKGHGNGKP